ncbi:FtsB family cell division protein [Pseudoflavonifractor phocaeensis]|uniref:FtsB family cell division protein n=1 Tax=Pseudoflavonifractor phocaeensis TaxID=1870988 RepID=UPI001F1B16E1|nr:septum formation initiator family protein [Pseudoflavonifractor phocaeensis]MDY3906408.1 septum formation initiator family protein [Lawsonibacter sp.]
MRFKQAGFLTKIVVLALLIYMTTSLLDLRGQIQATQSQRDTLAQQVADQRLENQELADAIEHSDDPEMLERVAREKGYVKQNEVLFFDVAN